MPSCSKNDVVLVHYPFTNLSGAKVRPAVVVSTPHASHDLFVVPLTSKIGSLLTAEFTLADWKTAGLNVPSAVKRGLFTLNERLIIKTVGKLSVADSQTLDGTIRGWLGM